MTAPTHTPPRHVRLEVFGVVGAGLYVATALAFQSSRSADLRTFGTSMLVAGAVAGAFVAGARVLGTGGI